MDTNNAAHIDGPISLEKIWQQLAKYRIKALLVRSTDHYFNEYVPRDLSARALITGFDGSVGDAIITTDKAHLFVDGRYSLQAKQQAKNFVVHVTDAAQSIETCWLKKLPEILLANDVLAYDPRTIDLALFDRLHSHIQTLQANVDACGEQIIDDVTGLYARKNGASKKLFKIDESVTGQSSSDKIGAVGAQLKKSGIDGFLVVKLDDIAWLTNLRCYYFPFQSTFPSIACAFPDQLFLGIKSGLTVDAAALPRDVTVVAEHELIAAISERFSPSQILGLEPQESSKAHELALRRANIELKRIANPISPLKAVKNEKELLHLRSAFKKADQVVHQTCNFVVESAEKGQMLTEADVDRHIREGFKNSGSEELSFRPICASGKNGAVIHYGTPNYQQAIEENSLFLLDTGAYYEGGYATDLTRTFLASKKSATAHKWQKEMFTLVLKASIAGLSARLRRGTLGIQLDALVRAPLLKHGLDFAHGTGHGVGINVHEFPPRIALTSYSELLEGHVFSIEPGLYFEGLGGVRIENLATVVKDPDNEKFLRVLPLTFSPLDERLIEFDMLDKAERAFLGYFKQEWLNQAPWPNLPPLTTTTFAAP